MDTAKALNWLGFTEGTVKSKADFEKLRARSKELYKKYAADKREGHAKKVMQAFEVLRVKFGKLQDGSLQRSSSITSNGSGKQVSGAEKPGAGAQASKAGGGAAGKQPAAGKPGAERPTLEKQRSERPGDAAKSLSKSGVAPAALTRKRPHAEAVKAPEPPLSRKASSSRSLGKLRSTSSVHKRASSRSLGSLVKAPSGSQVPATQERDTYLTCSCGESYRAKRFPRPIQKISGFLCPSCRVRQMDPFNPVLDSKRGMLKLVMVQKPYVPAEARQVGSFRLRFNVPRLGHWRKAGHSIEARMCCLDNVSATQAWSEVLTIEINGRKVVDIRPPQAGHKRRDVPKNLSSALRSGNNVVKVTLRDDYVQRFAIAFVRTAPRPPKEMCKRVPVAKVDDCKQKVVDLLFSSMLEGKSSEVECDEGSNISRLVCPITMDRITTPVRGVKCRHLQCFDLEAYLVSNMRMAAFNNRWHCPVCNLLIKPPEELFIDTYLLEILGKAEAEAEEVSFDATGGWTVSSTIAPDVDSDEDGAPPLSAFVPVPQVEDVDEAAGDEVDIVAAETSPPCGIEGLVSAPASLVRTDTMESSAHDADAASSDGGDCVDVDQDGSDCEDSDLLSDEDLPGPALADADVCGPPLEAEAGPEARPEARPEEAESTLPAEEPPREPSPELPWARPRFTKSPMPFSDAGSDDAVSEELSPLDLVSDDGALASGDDEAPEQAAEAGRAGEPQDAGRAAAAVSEEESDRSEAVVRRRRKPVVAETAAERSRESRKVGKASPGSGDSAAQADRALEARQAGRASKDGDHAASAEKGDKLAKASKAGNHKAPEPAKARNALNVPEQQGEAGRAKKAPEKADEASTALRASKAPEKDGELARPAKASRALEKDGETSRVSKASKAPEKADEASTALRASKAPEKDGELGRPAKASKALEKDSEASRVGKASKAAEKDGDVSKAGKVSKVPEPDTEAGKVARASQGSDNKAPTGKSPIGSQKASREEQMTKWMKLRVDNELLRAKSPGLGFRTSKDAKDMAPGKPYVKWGELVEGELEGDWLKVDCHRFAFLIQAPREPIHAAELYLPLISRGVTVLTEVKEASTQSEEQKAQDTSSPACDREELDAAPAVRDPYLDLTADPGSVRQQDLEADRALLPKLQESRRGAAEDATPKRARPGDEATPSLRGSQTGASGSATSSDARRGAAAEPTLKKAKSGDSATPSQKGSSSGASGSATSSTRSPAPNASSARPAAAAAFAAAAAAGAAARAAADRASAVAAAPPATSTAPPPPEASEAVVVPSLARKRSRLLACVDEDEEVDS